MLKRLCTPKMKKYVVQQCMPFLTMNSVNCICVWQFGLCYFHRKALFSTSYKVQYIFLARLNASILVFSTMLIGSDLWYSNYKIRIRYIITHCLLNKRVNETCHTPTRSQLHATPFKTEFENYWPCVSLVVKRPTVSRPPSISTGREMISTGNTWAEHARISGRLTHHSLVRDH